MDPTTAHSPRTTRPAMPQDFNRTRRVTLDLEPQSPRSGTPRAWTPSLETNEQSRRLLTPAERQRELFKYFQPFDLDNEPISNTGRTPHDFTLTAFAQLVCWRLDARRCIICYFGDGVQYVAAESTKTLDLDDVSRSEDIADALWQGSGSQCSYDQNSICLTTLSLAAGRREDTTFEVCDLTKDDRFRNLDCVTQDPHLRYYCGTTLMSSYKGIPIGTIYVVDEKPRAPATTEHKRFLHTMSRSVMSHLELLRERGERKRALKMNRYLSAFVNPSAESNTLKRRKTSVASHRRVVSNSSLKHRDSQSSLRSQRNMTEGLSDADSNLSDVSVASTAPISKDQKPRTDSRKKRAVEEVTGHDKVFCNAAQLLRKSLDISGGGGVVFLDSRASVRAGISSSPKERRKMSNVSIRGMRRNSFTAHASHAEVLAFSTDSNPKGIPRESDPETDEDENEASFNAISTGTIEVLLSRYPQGHLWQFDTRGGVVSDSESDGNTTEHQLAAEAAMLRQHFPEATQIMSVPIWDPSLSRWCVCFAYNTSSYRFFSQETEVIYLIAFCSCMTIELARLASLASDKLKSGKFRV
jgi:hypothetical protein